MAHAPRPPLNVGFVPIDPHQAGRELREAELAERRRILDEQTAALEADRVAFAHRSDELVAEHKRRESMYRDAAVAIEARIAECDKREKRLAEQAARANAGQKELETLRAESTATRNELQQRYNERRDRLAGLQQAVQNAATKLQQEKRELTGRQQELSTRSAELDRRERELAADREEHERARAATEAQHAGAAEKLRLASEQSQQRHGELDEREAKVAANEERHRADLIRLDRFQGTVDQRERQVAAAEAEVARKQEELHRNTLEMEDQARQLDAALTAQRAEDERLKQERLELESATSRLTERASQIEGQQAMLAALRTRLERMRNEVRQEATLLAEQRVRHEAAERDLQEKARAVEEMRAQVEADGLAHSADRQAFDGSKSELQAAIARLRELQERLTAEEAASAERRERLDVRAAEQAALAEELKGRATQLLELQEKLTADRAALKERDAALARDEEARKALQEQLRRRAEELATRQKQLDEQVREFEARSGAVVAEHEAAGRQTRAAESALADARQDLDRRTDELRHSADRLAVREGNLRRLTDRLRASGRSLAAGKKAHATAKARWDEDHAAANADGQRLRTELEDFRRQTAADADSLRQQLPDLELRGRAVLTRLGRAREELRGHLGELHEFARQGQDDLETVQSRIRAEAERLREQEAAINRARAEHRLAVTAFRQQLLEWQGRVADMRRVMADDGTRLERKEAAVSAAARQVDETAEQLKRQAADLQAAERQVSERRTEMERHLSDMREWYRRKLRELAESRGDSGGTADAVIVPLGYPRPDGRGSPGPSRSAGDLLANPGHAGSESSGHDILSLTDDLDPGDRQLGDLLRSLELVDADTLTALLLEARRTRRSLRQLLLSARGGTPLLTLYQLALIESGNLDALVLGPTRVIDRLSVTPREAVYRVFDPRRAADGQATVLLRHLSEAEMHDAVHPDEFRQRFAALAAIEHPHLAATLEVLEINGRPAALQEWLSGLPSADWPPIIAVPAVWHRLLSETATAIHAAHRAGIVHGRLTARSVVLTPEGVVKLTGCGEPPWLTGGPADATPADDVAALGELACAWATNMPLRKRAKTFKSPAAALRPILNRLRSDAADRYQSTGDLLADLEKAGPELPPIGDAWENLVAFANQNAADAVAWRKSA
jgi:chromosome segregation ATPase